MVLRSALLLFSASLFVARVASQQGVISNGNSQLPSCALTCPKLMQAARACTATSSATQANWICFCQSAYLSTLFTSDAGICDDVCTSASDSQQVSTWYKSNCGTDNGQNEHANAGSGASTTTTPAGSNPTTTTAVAATSTAASSSLQGSQSKSSGGGTWWSTHYQWIIMLIVLVVALPALAFLLVFLKRRHDRKQDQITGGFNAGITTRTLPSNIPHKDSMGFAAGSVDDSGRNSPARTRDAFMPYGYGYNRSDSRLASGQAGHDDRGSPLARAEMQAGGAQDEKQTGRKKSRALVRERSSEDEIEREKSRR